MDIEQAFTHHGFELLGTYKGPRTPTLIRCTAHGYTSEQTLEDVQAGLACKYCLLRDARLLNRAEGPKRKRSPRNLDRRREAATQMAKLHGFELLGEYKDSRSRVLVRCSNGHETMKTTNDMQQGSGCRLCYAQRLLVVAAAKA